MSDAEPIRLSKRMSELGLASRREADEWIERGWVKVDGAVAILGLKVLPHQEISIDGRARKEQAKRLTVILHKPIGYVSGQAEEGHTPASVLITPDNQWHETRVFSASPRAAAPATSTWGKNARGAAEPARRVIHKPAGPSAPAKPLRHQDLWGFAPAGRLDIDSTGLLVMTQDGRIAKLLIGEDSDIEKEYLVRVRYSRPGALPAEDLRRLNHGLSLDGKTLRPAQVDWQNEDQLRFVLREGRKRQIRRMCELVGLEVQGLKRVRIGKVMLGKLPAGKWRMLGENEQFG